MNKIVYTPEELARRVAPIAVRHNIRTVFVFGSYARRDAGPESDIDLLLDLKDSDVQHGFAIGGLYEELTEAFGKRIDLVTIATLEQESTRRCFPGFIQEVERERQLLYAWGWATDATSLAVQVRTWWKKLEKEPKKQITLDLTSRDRQRLEHMLVYCKDILDTQTHFGGRDAFLTNRLYQNAIGMPFLQLGELAKGLSENFQEKTRSIIPWHEIRGFRNVLAHEYGEVGLARVWDNMIADVPALKSFCEKVLAETKPS